MTLAPTHSSTSPRVQLMASCLCDAFFDDVAIATVEVLEHLGCRVEFPEAQTCCGQPAFNSGDWGAALPVSRHTLRVFQGAEPVVVPSGSCARMLSHGSLLLFEKESDRDAARELAQRSFELAEFIVRKLGVTSWPGRLRLRLAFHRSCHSRGTAYAESALTLLRSIAGLELVELEEGEQCCGFGGTFSVTFPNVSRDMGQLKLRHFAATHADALVSSDMGCLMHLNGLAEKQQAPLRALHLAQVLRDALREVRS
jgi:L-lactate dehydrogenase complex protein LldE